MKGRIYQSCVRLETLQQSLTCCLQENEITILKKTERALYGAELIEKRSGQELIELLSLKATLNRLAKVNGMQ